MSLDERTGQQGSIPPTAGRRAVRWGRRIVLAGAAGLAALLAARLIWSGVEGWRLGSVVKEAGARHGSLAPASLAPPEVPDAENRAVLYRAAAEIVDVGREGRRTAKALAGSGTAGASEETSRAAASIVDRNHLALLLVSEGFKRPRSSWEIRYRDGVEARLPDLRGLIDVTRVLQMKAMLDIQAGRLPEAVGRLEEGFALSSSLRAEPLIIIQMVRQSMDRILIEAARALLARGEPAASDLGRLARALPEETPAALRAALAGEMKTLHDVMVKLESGRDPLGRPEGGIAAAGAAWLLRPLAFNAHRRILTDMMQALAAEPGPDDLKRGAAPAEPHADWNPIYRAITPAGYLGQTRARAAAAEARSALARAAAALRRHRLERGAYPKSLQALVPAFLERLPLDPFTGASPDYALEGAGFTLRSAGEGIVAALPGPVIADDLLVWRIPS